MKRNVEVLLESYVIDFLALLRKIEHAKLSCSSLDEGKNKLRLGDNLSSKENRVKTR